MKLILLLILVVILNHNLIAGGSTGVGGGGDVIVLPNDSIVLADPWIDTDAPQPNNMPPLRALNPRILQGALSYLKAVEQVTFNLSKNKQSDIFDLLSELTLRKTELRFYGVQSVEELNNYCAPGGQKIYKLPNGATVQRVACTAGDETFLVEPIFIKLTLRDQILLLFHERLTTLRDQYGGKNYAAIAKFTTGFGVYLNLFSEQGQKKYRNLSENEIVALTDFYISIEEIEFRNNEIDEDSFQWKAHLFGGGMIHSTAQVDSTALISLNSLIPRNSIVESGVFVINLKVNSGIVIKLSQNTKMTNSVINNLNFNIKNRKTFELQENSQIENSTFSIKEGSFVIGSNNFINNTSIKLNDFSTGNNSKFIESSIEGSSLKTGQSVEFNHGVFNNKYNSNITDGEKLVFANINSSTVDKFFPEDAVINPVRLSFVADKFSCEFNQKLDKKIILNTEGDVKISGNGTYSGKPNVFKKLYTYDFDKLNISVNETFANNKNTDQTMKVLNKIGKIVSAGYLKGPRNIGVDYPFNGYCFHNNIIKSIYYHRKEFPMQLKSDYYGIKTLVVDPEEV